jgi:hypothetical protein
MDSAKYLQNDFSIKNYVLSRLNFFIKMYSVSDKCLIFTPINIIDFYLFFGQNIGGKELTIAKDHISKAN